jgi:hypothetical protein
LKHKTPHIHVYYQEQNAVFEIPSGKILEGKIPKAKHKLVDAWIELRKEDLMADWNLAINGEILFKIAPLK